MPAYQPEPFRAAASFTGAAEIFIQTRRAAKAHKLSTYMSAYDDIAIYFITI